MTWSLRGLLLSLTSIALVGMVATEAVVELRQRAREAESQIQAQTRLLTSAGAPLLLNALVVGDLATAEQTLRSVNADGVWRLVRLYEPDGRRLIKVYLPIAAQALAAAEAGAPAVGPSRGSETVLVAEDEEGVRDLARNLLEAFGYRVLEAADPDEAMAVSRRHVGPVDLLLTDVIMPGISGRELADRLRAERPALKILYMSGYTDRAIVHHGVLDPDVAFLEKPFAAADLRRKVREVLDGPDSRAGAGASSGAPGRGAGLEAV